jgi:four helix bundle protein
MCVNHNDGFIGPHGNYEELLSYRKAEIVFDVTYEFCKRFLKRNDRTVDQMIQAARSGKQNIMEGSKASGTSKRTEIRLTDVARASLEELLGDYKDFLRTRKLKTWDKNGREALYVRRLGKRPDVSYEDFRAFLKTALPKLWRTSHSVLSTRQTISSINKSAALNKTS